MHCGDVPYAYLFLTQVTVAELQQSEIIPTEHIECPVCCQGSRDRETKMD